MVYNITCVDCKVEGVDAQYWGETHRSMWDRQVEHLQDLQHKKEESPLVKHWTEVHRGKSTPPIFSHKVVSSHRTACDRQIAEALAIARDSSEMNMNSKGEFGYNVVVRSAPEPTPWQEVQHRVQGNNRKRKRLGSPSNLEEESDTLGVDQSRSAPQSTREQRRPQELKVQDPGKCKKAGPLDRYFKVQGKTGKCAMSLSHDTYFKIA